MKVDSLAYLAELLAAQQLPVVMRRSTGTIGEIELAVETTIFYEHKSQQNRYLKNKTFCLPFTQLFQKVDLSAVEEISSDDLMTDVTGDSILAETMLSERLKPLIAANSLDRLPKPADLKQFGQQVVDYLYHYDHLKINKNEITGLIQREDESQEDFQLRVTQAGEVLLKQKIEKLETTQQKELQALETKISRTKQSLAREEAEAKTAKTQTLISLGATLLSSLLGSKKISHNSLGRATTAARSASRSSKQQSDVLRVEDQLKQLEEELAAKQADFESALEQLKNEHTQLLSQFTEEELRPLKRDIRIDQVSMCLKMI